MDNKVINQLHMREMNLNEVLKIIREEESLTRRKLQDLTGLSWGGVSQIVTRLLSQNLIIEVKDTSPGPGRKPTCLQINGEENLLLGVDINSSGITAVIQNLKNEILEQISIFADCSARKKLLADTFQLTDQLFEKYKERKILATGISMQGAVDEKKRVSLYLKECPDWENVPLCDLFEERYKIPAYLAHDPDCLVASNVSMFGEDVLLCRIDYGIGLSVFKNGDFIKGPGMLEIGRMLLRTETGKIKTLDQIASIAGIEKNAETPLTELKNTERGRQLLQEATEALALTIANSALLFDVSTILLCGKFFTAEQGIWDELKEELLKLLPKDTRIFRYDEKRAAAGAAWIAAERRIK